MSKFCRATHKKYPDDTRNYDQPSIWAILGRRPHQSSIIFPSPKMMTLRVLREWIRICTYFIRYDSLIGNIKATDFLAVSRKINAASVCWCTSITSMGVRSDHTDTMRLTNYWLNKSSNLRVMWGQQQSFLDGRCLVVLQRSEGKIVWEESFEHFSKANIIKGPHFFLTTGMKFFLIFITESTYFHEYLLYHTCRMGESKDNFKRKIYIFFLKSHKLEREPKIKEARKG